jgi:hypothetical protein
MFQFHLLQSKPSSMSRPDLRVLKVAQQKGFAVGFLESCMASASVGRSFSQSASASAKASARMASDAVLWMGSRINFSSRSRRRFSVRTIFAARKQICFAREVGENGLRHIFCQMFVAIDLPERGGINKIRVAFHQFGESVLRICLGKLPEQF